MGTRSVTTVVDQGTPLVAMYRQFDGYPEGHGLELAKFLASGEMVNGLGQNPGRVFNGASCLAAQMVAHFKKRPGDFYLVPIGQHEEYNYQVDVNYLDITVTVYKGTRPLFKGTVEEFLKFCGSVAEPETYLPL